MATVMREAPHVPPAKPLTDEDAELLFRAHQRLEHPSLAARLSGVVGMPIEIALRLLPKPWWRRLHAAMERGVAKALNAAISSLRVGPITIAHDRFYRVLGMGSGAFGGYYGLWGLPMEVPITTTIMLRSIADIARSQGEDLRGLDTRLACLEVFALGGRTEEDDAADTGYYGLRLALGLSITHTSSHVARHGLQKGGPVLVDLIRPIAARFGPVLSEKVAAHAVPLVGAASGALINGIFMDHFQDMARNHFTVRRLERKYGTEMIREAYESFR